MTEVTMIGLDLAKSVFQVHGVDAGGQVVVRRQLRRRQVLAFFERLPPCLAGLEPEGFDGGRARRLVCVSWPRSSMAATARLPA